MSIKNPLMARGSVSPTIGRRSKARRGMKVIIKKLNIISKLKYRTLFLKLKYLITKKVNEIFYLVVFRNISN